METLADKLDTVETNQYTKARKLVENNDIWIHRAHLDRVVFKIQGNNDQYTLGFDPQTKESMCGCPAQTYNNGDCYHKIAAQIFLSQNIQEAKTVQKEIIFTQEHLEKIKNGEKTSTLRTVKKQNLYPVGEPLQAKANDKTVPIKIKGRKILVVMKEGIREFDNGASTGNIDYTGEQVADIEGFESYDDLINWFYSRNYNIPQPMFLYSFKTFGDDDNE